VANAGNTEDRSKIEALKSGDQASLQTLISDLSSKDDRVRCEARKSLIGIGKSAAILLIEALEDPRDVVRLEASKALDSINLSWQGRASPQIVRLLVGDLGSNDGIVRVTARRLLAAIGEDAIKELEQALKNKNQWMRWEAAKTLGQIGDPAAIDALIRALRDDVFDVRWLAAEGLIAIGRPSVVPLLKALVEHAESLWMREGAHHVLHDIRKEGIEEILQPVMIALEDVEPSLGVPLAARKALDELYRLQPQAIFVNNKPSI